MVARCILLALASSALCVAMAGAQAHPVPPADVVKQLRRHHHRGDWWRVTTDDGRYEVRVKQIDAEGLGGFTARRSAPPVPERLAWASIARIDLRKSHARRGQITWMILGLGAGLIPLANGNANSNQPAYYMLAGATVGAALGGRMSGMNVHERALYVAPMPALPMPAAPPDVAVSEPREAIPPSAPSASASPEIERACRRISSQDLLRVEGDFGTFHGYASSIGPEGLGGLRVETTRESVQPPGLIDWDRIHRVDVHGSNAGRGALRGAVALGAATAVLGFPIAALAQSGGSGSDTAGIVLACAGVGAGIGLVLGGTIGATIPGWHLVYRRR